MYKEIRVMRNLPTGTLLSFHALLALAQCTVYFATLEWPKTFDLLLAMEKLLDRMKRNKVSKATARKSTFTFTFIYFFLFFFSGLLNCKSYTSRWRR